MKRPMHSPLPCPFCGNEPKTNTHFAWCIGPESDPHILIQQYLETWNHRAAVPHEAGLSNEDMRREIETARSEAGLSWKAFANSLGTSETHLCEMANGKRAVTDAVATLLGYDRRMVFYKARAALALAGGES